MDAQSRPTPIMTQERLRQLLVPYQYTPHYITHRYTDKRTQQAFYGLFVYLDCGEAKLLLGLWGALNQLPEAEVIQRIEETLERASAQE